MTRQQSGFVASIAILTLFNSTSNADNEVDEVIDNILARADAIVSGRITFRFTDVGGNESTMKTVFSGSSWKVDEPAFHIERINHRGSFVEVRRTPQPDGSTTHSAVFETEKPIDTRTPQPPIFAGTPWYRTTNEYIQAHREKIKRAGQETVSGELCTILTLQVPAADRYRAFHSIISALDGGGILRLFVAPKLGYAMPRIEYVSPERKVAVRFESSDFKECGKGLFVPLKIVRLTYANDGRPPASLTYTIDTIQDVNEPILDTEFVVSLSKDTYVSDLRGPKPVSYIVGDVPVNLREIPTNGASILRESRWKTRVVRGLLIAINILMLLGLGYLLLRRRSSR